MCQPRKKMTSTQTLLDSTFNTLRPKLKDRNFANYIFKCIFLNENCCIVIAISLKYVLRGPIINMLTMVQIMVWRRRGDKPLSEPKKAQFTEAYMRPITRPKWVNPCNCDPMNNIYRNIVSANAQAPAGTSSSAETNSLFHIWLHFTCFVL